MLDTTVRNHGHRSCISRNSASEPRPRRPSPSTAVPTPNQPGSIRRHWLQLDTHGIARRSSMRPELVRDAGREPMFIVDSSTMGVIARNHSSNPGSRRPSSRYVTCDAVDNSSASHTNPGRRHRFHPRSTVDSTAAATNASRFWRARSGSANLAEIISPCSVIRRPTCTLPAGWAMIAW